MSSDGFDFNLPNNGRLPGETQRVEILEQDRSDTAKQVNRQHDLILSIHYLADSINLGLPIAVFFTFGLVVPSMFPFFLVLMGLISALLVYSYHHLGKWVFYTLVCVLMAAFVIAFSMIP